jgi:hypothetical protein
MVFNINVLIQIPTPESQPIVLLKKRMPFENYIPSPNIMKMLNECDKQA